MIDPTPPDPAASSLSLDVFLRDVLPEVKLALGEAIDRENTRALPGRYARLLPESLLAVALRPDAAEAIAPIAAELERELTDSCTRHGSLYDRVYRVQLRRTEADDAPLFAVSAHAGHDLASAGARAEAERSRAPQPEATEAAPAAPPVPAAAAPLPLADPDATRAEGIEATPGWESGRWLLVVEDEAGDEHEAFRLAEPFTTVGRQSDDPQLQVGIGLSGAPHVSRRQLALLWDGASPGPGFRVYNLGLNPIHHLERQVPGAKLGRGALKLEELEAAHSVRVEPEAPFRIGDSGPTLRIREVPAPAEDPDATQFG